MKVTMTLTRAVTRTSCLRFTNPRCRYGAPTANHRNDMPMSAIDSNGSSALSAVGIPPRRTKLAMASLLGVLTVAVYALALDGPFLLDDLVNLPGSKPSENSWRGVLDVVFANDSGPLGRPLAILTFALQYLYDPPDAFAFKVVNLGVHLLNVLLFSCLAERLLGATEDGATTPDEDQARTRALALFACVAVFALHPLQVSTVMYVVQRMTLLAQTFGLLAMLAYVIVRADDTAPRHARVAFAGAVLPLIGLGLLCKETAALVPLYLVLIELTVFRLSRIRPEKGWGSEGLSDGGVRVAFVAGSVLLAVGGTYLLLATSVLAPLMVGYEGRAFTLAERAATQPHVVLEYMRMVVIPDPGLMSFHHDDVPVGQTSATALAVASLALVALWGLAILVVARLPLVALGIGLFLSSHLLESTVFPLEPMFEHRNYPGMGGIGLIVAGLLVRVEGDRRAGAAVGVAVVVLALLTFQRCLVWSDELTLNRFAVEAAPESLRARSAYAISLVRAGDVQAGLSQLEAAATLAPDDPYFPLELLQTKALAGRADTGDVDRAAASLGSGRLSLNVEVVLADLLRNAEAGRLDGLDPASLSSLYAVAERRYGEFAPVRAHARLVARAAEAHLLAGRYGDSLSSADEAARRDPQNVDIALRRLELRAGLQPDSIGAVELAAFAAAGVALDAVQRRRLAAVRKHVAELSSE